MNSAASTRRFDMDWLRIVAFALLVPYHVGMYYVTWDWHIKSPFASHALEPWMFLTAPWRLSLLFFVSGVALAHAMRTRRGQLAWTRSKRLLLPLLFGMFCIVVPQVYLELKQKMPGFAMTPWAFYWRYLQGGDIYCARPHDCIDAPTWNHLWFVAYLWVYTMVALTWANHGPAAARTRLKARLDRLLAGWGVIFVPMGLLALCRVFVYPVFDSTHDLVDDWYNHAQYGVAMGAGMAIAFNDPAWQKLRATRWAMTGLWGLCYLVLLAYFVRTESTTAPIPPFLLNGQRVVWGIMSWAAICAAAGHAMRFRHTDNGVRKHLTEAIFPLYILHQTVIILLAWNMRRLHLPWPIEGVCLTVLTFVLCGVAVMAIRRIAVLRPLFGLPFKRAANAAPSTEPPRRPATRPERVDTPA